MSSQIFSSWFRDNFVPQVQSKLLEMGQEPKALLILDNCSTHPHESELVSADGRVKAKYLPPPHVTSLIQPMYQGVFESLKRIYCKSLLQDLLLSDSDIDNVTFLKSINMLVQWNLPNAVTQGRQTCWL